MEIFRFDSAIGKPITQYNSSGMTLSSIVRTAQPASISCLHLDPNGVVGHHPAAVRQLLLVVQGQGWVRAQGPRVPITAGRAVFWQAGEWHETGTDTGLMAIIVESEALDPASFMPREP